MPYTAVPQPQADAGLHLNHRVMYYVIRPVAKRLPVRVLSALAMLAAIPVGILYALRRADHYRRVLATLGRPTGVLSRMGLAIRSLYAKARHIDWYVYEGTPHPQVTWDGQPETGPCIFVLCHTYGLENVASFMDRYPATLVRLAYAGEGELDLATAAPGQKWRAHQAHLRQRHAETHRHVIVGQNPLAYRQVMDGKDSVILYQDLHDPSKPDGPPLLGHPVTLRMGALKIAKRAPHMPVRYMSIAPAAGTWKIHIGPRIPATYEAIAAAIEADIRNRPAMWMLWRDFFAYVDGPATAEAERRRPAPVLDAETMPVNAEPQTV